jgi:hypothetical protein
MTRPENPRRLAMMSPILLVVWIPVIVVAAILLPSVLLLGAAVGIDGAFRPRPVERTRVEPPPLSGLRELPRKAA